MIWHIFMPAAAALAVSTLILSILSTSRMPEPGNPRASLPLRVTARAYHPAHAATVEPEPTPVEHQGVDEARGLDGFVAAEPAPEIAAPTERERQALTELEDAYWENELFDFRTAGRRALDAFRAAISPRIDPWIKAASDASPRLLVVRTEARGEDLFEQTGHIPRIEALQ